MRFHYSLLIIILAFSLGSCGGRGEYVQQGVCDLSKWDRSRPTVYLDGKWEFYWSQLVQWDERSIEDRKYASFSEPWSEQMIDGMTMPKNGYATYAAQVIVPESVKEISLKVPAVFNSYALWVNDELVSSNGKVADHEDRYLPKWKPNAVKVKPLSGQLRIIFQIANFQHTRGGSAEPLLIAPGDILMVQHHIYQLSGKVVTGIFILAGILAVVFFLFTTQSNILFFGLMAFAFALRFLFSDHYLYDNFLSEDLTWNTVARIEYLSVPLIILWGALFFAGKYPHEFRRSLKLFFVLVNLALIACVIGLPTKFLSELLTIIQIVALAFLVSVAYIVVKALVNSKHGAWTSASGILVFAIIGSYNVAAYLSGWDLNHLLIDAGYTLALFLNAISLFYRTPLRIGSEAGYELKYSDFFPESDRQA